MDPSTFTGSFTLKDSSGNPVPGTDILDSETQAAANFYPSQNLAYSTTYTATVVGRKRCLWYSYIISKVMDIYY